MGDTTAEGWGQTWTDGGVVIGPNGMVYSMKSFGHAGGGTVNLYGPPVPGCVRAYMLEDGKFVWESETMHDTPNSWPVVGRLHEGGELLVMAPLGTPTSYPFIALTQQWLDNFMPASLSRIITKPLHLISFYLSNEWSQRLWRNREYENEVWGLAADTGKTRWKWGPGVWKRASCAGDE